MMIILFGFYVIVLNGFLYSMDSDQQLKVRSLNCIKGIGFVHCLDSTRIIVDHAKGLSIIDSRLDREVKKIIELDSWTRVSTTLSSDQKTIFLCDFYKNDNQKTIYKYDIKTASIVEDFTIHTSLNISDYSCYQNILFLSGKEEFVDNKGRRCRGYTVESYNYDNKTYKNGFFYKDYAVFRVHPTKPILYMLDGEHISLYDENDLSIKKQSIPVTHKLSFRISVNGLIGLVDQWSKYASIVNPKNNQTITLNAQEGESFLKILFYSESVAVIISRVSNGKQSNEKMSYWDINTQTSFYSMNLSEISKVVFFPDGKECVVVSSQGCNIYKVPVSARSRRHYVVD